jgi:hypothetical protein
VQSRKTDIIPSIDDFVTRNELNKKIEYTECDFSSLYDPSFNDLSGKEILGNCDSKTILKKLGLKYTNFKPQSNISICKHRLCSYNTYTRASLKRHMEICHTKIKGFRLWKCPHYNKCNFGISGDLLTLDKGKSCLIIICKN